MKEFGEKKKGVEYRERKGSYAVIVDGRRVGVVRAKGYETFFLAGGGLDEGETETGALRREAREEIGREIEIGEKIGAAREYFYSQAEGRHVAKECHFYRVALAGESNGEGKHELVWIAPAEIGRMHHECYRWVIEEELKRLRSGSTEFNL